MLGIYLLKNKSNIQTSYFSDSFFFFVPPCGYLLVIIGKTTLIIDKFTKFKLKSEET